MMLTSRSIHLICLLALGVIHFPDVNSFSLVDALQQKQDISSHQNVRIRRQLQTPNKEKLQKNEEDNNDKHRRMETWSNGNNETNTTNAKSPAASPTTNKPVSKPVWSWNADKSENTTNTTNTTTSESPSVSPSISDTLNPTHATIAPTSLKPVWVAPVTTEPTTVPPVPTQFPSIASQMLTSVPSTSSTTFAPSTNSTTTSSPTMEPTEEGTLYREPTKAPITNKKTSSPPTSNEPTIENTLEQTTIDQAGKVIMYNENGEIIYIVDEKSNDVNNNTEIQPEKQDDNNITHIQNALTIPIDTITLNFFLDAPSKIDIDLETIQRVTAHHILRQIQIIETNGGVNSSVILVQDVANVTVKPIGVYTQWIETNNTVVQTYEINGIVVLHDNKVEGNNQAIFIIINELIKKSFDSVDENRQFLALLEISSDSALRRAYSVYRGPASDLMLKGNSSPGSSSNTSPGTPQNKAGHFSTPVMLAIVIAGSISGCAILVLIGFLINSLRREHQNEKFEKVLESKLTAKKDDIEQHDNISSTNTNSTNGSTSKPTIRTIILKMKNEKKTNPEQEKVITVNVQKDQNMLNQSQQFVMPKTGEESDPGSLNDDIAEALRTIRLHQDQSDVSSVYSYIETNNLVDMLQDEAYSVCNVESYKFDEDDDNNTRNGTWSVNADEQMSIVGGRKKQNSASDSLLFLPSPAVFQMESRNQKRGSIGNQPVAESDNDTITTAFGGEHNAKLSNTPTSKNNIKQNQVIKDPSQIVIVHRDDDEYSMLSGLDAGTGMGSNGSKNAHSGSNLSSKKSSSDKDSSPPLHITSRMGDHDTESSTSASSTDEPVSKSKRFDPPPSANLSDDGDQEETEIIRATVAERRIAATALSYGDKFKARQHQKYIMLPKSRTNKVGQYAVEVASSSTSKQMYQPNNNDDESVNAETDAYESDIQSVDGDQSLFSSFSKNTGNNETSLGGKVLTDLERKNLNFHNILSKNEVHKYETDGDDYDDGEDDDQVDSSIMLPAAYDVALYMSNKNQIDTDDDLSSTGGSMLGDDRNYVSTSIYSKSNPFNDLASF